MWRLSKIVDRPVGLDFCVPTSPTLLTYVWGCQGNSMDVFSAEIETGWCWKEVVFGHDWWCPLALTLSCSPALLSIGVWRGQGTDPVTPTTRPGPRPPLPGRNLGVAWAIPTSSCTPQPTGTLTQSVPNDAPGLYDSPPGWQEERCGSQARHIFLQCPTSRSQVAPRVGCAPAWSTISSFQHNVWPPRLFSSHKSFLAWRSMVCRVNESHRIIKRGAGWTFCTLTARRPVGKVGRLPCSDRGVGYFPYTTHGSHSGGVNITARGTL